MKCPACRTGSVAQKEIEPGLAVSCCNSCSGIWIARSKYDAWVSKQPRVESTADNKAQLQVNDIPKAKVCPQCGHLLMKYRIGHSLDFQIDNCSTCGGFWFDGNEWQALKAKHLHVSLIHILAPTWQKDALKEEVRQKIEQTYSSRLGAQVFTKAKEIKTWLGNQQEKAAILAYLTD